MDEMHPLLRRQMRRHLGEQALAPELQPFLRAVLEAYQQADLERGLLERSLDLSSQELIQANADMSAVLQAFPDLLFRLDASGTILGCKGFAPEDFHAPPGTLVGKRIQDVPQADVGALFEDALATVQRTRRMVDVEYLLPTAQGESAFEARLVPMMSSHVVAIIRNITERRRTESALRESEAMLRQAQKMEAVGRLAGGIAHDFNNLLTVILGYGEMLRDEVTGDRADHVDEIHRAATRAANLTQQLLAFSRRQVLQPRVLSVNEVVTGMEVMLRRLIGAHIDIVVHLCPAAGQVRADPGQLEQVVMNLALNARDAMHGGGRLVIETAAVAGRKVGADPSGSACAMISVTDSGCGMTELTRARIFEPFFTTKEPGKGTGLGLATVHGIVTQSGGSLEVESSVGRGSTFRVFLPRIDAPCETPSRAHATCPKGRGERILVVEDEDAVRRLVLDLLRNEGYEVVEARGGVEALEACRIPGGPFALLLTDIVMPGMNGFALAEAARGLQTDLRVLFMSGYADLGPEAPELDEGATLIRKPFQRDALARIVRDMVDPPVPSLAC